MWACGVGRDQDECVLIAWARACTQIERRKQRHKQTQQELKEEFERGYFGDLREELRRMPRKGATPVSPAAGQQPASAGTAPPAQVTPLLPVSRSSSSSSSSLGRCAHVR